MSHGTRGPAEDSKYSEAFKLTAVRMMQLPGMQVKTVAAGLDLHPFMLSRWRKEVRDGVIRGRLPRRAPSGPSRRAGATPSPSSAHALLQEEHDLLKRPYGSVPFEGRSVRLHRHPAGHVRRDAPVSRAQVTPVGFSMPASSLAQRARATGPATPHGDHATLHATPRTLRQPAHPPPAVGEAGS
ncbi:MAG: transposase [Gemmatimonadetes bacterium]|nr:transposase [Gemmatimonadota bacterium]